MDKFKNKFKIDLQMFNDEGADETEDTTETAEETPPTTEEEEKTFDQEAVNAIVVERLAREKAKFEKEFKAKLEIEKKEAERLAKLSEADREKAIMETAKAEFEAERLSFQREKLELQITKELAEKGLPVSFAKLLVTGDADTSLENIKVFEKDWQVALEKAVTEKLKGTSPTAGATATTESGLGKRLAAIRKESEGSIKENPYF